MLPQCILGQLFERKKDFDMKKIFLFLALITLAGCCNCDVEPIVEQNQKLIVPPHFGQMPK